MKRSNKLLLIALIITALTALFLSFSTLSANAAANVVYISADGTGDGSSPDKPLGNAADYKTEVGSEPGNAFYRGLDKLKSVGGTVVIVGDVYIDSAHSRVPANKNERKAPSEFDVPSFRSGKSVTITSVYNNVDYRKQGAQLIFDHDKCNTAMLVFSFPATFKDVDIEYRYDPSSNNAWDVPFILGGGGKPLTIDTGVNVTSYNTLTKKAGDVFPILIGGTRYSNSLTNTDVIVRSGTWSTVIAGSFGMIDATPDRGTVSGNATLIIEGGKIDTVVGSGSLKNPSGSVKGVLSINVKGGEINKLYISNDRAFGGTDAHVTISKEAMIKYFFFAPTSYKGEMAELVGKVKLTNNSSLSITVPGNLPLPEPVPETEAPAETESPEETTDHIIIPSTEPVKENIYIEVPIPEDTRPLKEVIEQDFIHPKVFIGFVIACVAIALGFGVFYLLKKIVVR